MTLGINVQCASVFETNNITNFSDGLKRELEPLPAHAVMVLLRTWSNGWFTSCRTHTEEQEDRWPCIFGCENEKDDLGLRMKRMT